MLKRYTGIRIGKRIQLSIQNLSYFFLISILVTAYSSCKKFDNYVPDIIESIENLNIPDNFNWNTNNLVNFSISADNSRVIEIKSIDGNSLFHKGFYNTLTEYYDVKVSIPTSFTDVLVNDVIVPLNSTTISVNLNIPSAKSVLKSTNSGEPSGSIAIWHLNENNGTTTSDVEENYKGKITGAKWVPGINGSALNFDGETGNVNIPMSEKLNIISNKLSISLWFKRDHMNDDGSFLFQNMKYILRIDKWGKITFAVYNPDWSVVTVDWKERIIDTDWHHIVATYDGEKMKLYVDKKLMVEKETEGNLRSSNSDILIGSQTSRNYFEGIIDEVFIYERALNEDEISQINTTTQNPDNGSNSLISEWNFNEGNGSKVSDPINKLNGEIQGASWVSGVNGNCLSFDGEDDNVSIPHSSNLAFQDELTISAWAKSKEYKEAKIAQKGDWDGYGIGGTKWGGWKGHIRLNNDQSTSIESKDGRPILNEWYHIALTYNGSILKLYINGQLNATKSVSGQLKVNSRDISIGSDSGKQKFFNGLIDEVKFYNKALGHTEIQAIFKNQDVASDGDGDGIPDENDDHPNDPARAFNNFYPVAGYGSLAFEDLWPGKGDYDFNDLVLDYRFTIVTNASNKVSDIRAEFIVKAIGAGFSNGFGFQLPNANIETNDLNISGYNLKEEYINLNENGTEAGQDKITVIVFDNAKRVLEASSGFGVNVSASEAYVKPDTTRININFNTSKYTIADINIQEFNPFLIVDGDRGKEIHLPNFAPTALVNTSFFGTLNDNSIPGNGRYYKTSNNLPWAINIPESYQYTIEKAQIISGHLKFGDWAESGGTQFTDWYKNKNGYRNGSSIYQIPY